MPQLPYENLLDTQFEDLVIRICKVISWVSAQTSPGPDGATKISWFEGTAENTLRRGPGAGNLCHPGKHRQFQNASCTDNDFLSKHCSRKEEGGYEIKKDPFDNSSFYQPETSGEPPFDPKAIGDDWRSIMQNYRPGTGQSTDRLSFCRHGFGLHHSRAPFGFMKK